MRGDKRPSRKHDRKVLVAEEITKSWADTDSESSSSSSSSSDSEQEEVHCLMADQALDDEVFDFSNVEFRREDLVSALNDMVKEYRKLSHSFEEAKAENIMSSEGETSTQSQPAYDKFNKMSFVKANVIYDCFESITFDDQNSPKLSDNGKAGIDFQRPENSKPSWLKNKLDKIKRKLVPTASLHDLCSRLESTSLEESDDDVPQRQSAEEEQPAVVTTHNNVQQDLTGNPIVIDLTNVDQPQDQIASSVPTVGGVATNDQPADDQSVIAPTDVDKQDVAQAVASASPLVSRPTPEAPAGSTNYQLVSPPAGHQKARAHHIILY
ncbi:Flavin-dependent monooxygenase 1 [Dorcoceras hygrometricum]|uniref:Flavin-dependent monooxygenase 1 n=1 Tax=Dorcoceras hygrometricum TaxID=472368 RepID=A0A2Z7AXS9_9LAMI|nr:Flavin-dependent monooxygenase 1 [Dorcoceras hygrometricum]